MTEAEHDAFVANKEQNIIIVSTPDADRERKYSKIKEIEINGRKHEVGAYATVPEGTTKGVIRNTPLDHSQETILAKLITDRNPTVIGARRIGNTPTIIVAFEGDRVPRQVYYGSSILECSLYRKHFDFCTTCGEIGHRRDVCPTPNVRVCADCGLKNPKEGHSETCKPTCKLCNGPHPTGTYGCKNRYKTPYIVTKRRWARKEAEEERRRKEQESLAPGSFPELERASFNRGQGRQPRSVSRRRSDRSASNKRDQSRCRSKSKDRVSWNRIVQDGAARKESTTRSSTPSNIKTNQDEAIQNEADALRKENAQLRSTIESMAEQMKIISQQLHALQAQQTEQARQPTQERQAPQQQQQPREEQQAEPMGEDNSASECQPQQTAASEPSPKRRAVENIKERKLIDRVNKLEDTVTSLKQEFNSLKSEISRDMAAIIQQSITAAIQQTVMPAIQQSVNAAVQQCVQQHMSVAIQQIREEISLSIPQWTGPPQAQ